MDLLLVYNYFRGCKLAQRVAFLRTTVKATVVTCRVRNPACTTTKRPWELALYKWPKRPWRSSLWRYINKLTYLSMIWLLLLIDRSIDHATSSSLFFYSVGKLGDLALTKMPLGDAIGIENPPLGAGLINCGVPEACDENSFSVHMYTGLKSNDMCKLCINGR